MSWCLASSPKPAPHEVTSSPPSLISPLEQSTHLSRPSSLGEYLLGFMVPMPLPVTTDLSSLLNRLKQAKYFSSPRRRNTKISVQILQKNQSSWSGKADRKTVLFFGPCLLVVIKNLPRKRGEKLDYERAEKYKKTAQPMLSAPSSFCFDLSRGQRLSYLELSARDRPSPAPATDPSSRTLAGRASKTCNAKRLFILCPCSN